MFRELAVEPGSFEKPTPTDDDMVGRNEAIVREKIT